MRAFVNFSLILIAGILGTTIAQESHEIKNLKVEKIRHIQHAWIHGFDFEGMSDELPDEMKTFNSPKCRLNGGPNADTNVTESLGILLNSITALNNETRQQLDDIANNQHIGIDAAIKTTCKWATSLNSVVRIFTNSYKRCLDSEERRTIDLISNVSSAVLQYVCEDNGKHLSAFLAADVENCIWSSFQRIDSCMAIAFTGDNTSVKRSNSPIFPLWRDPVITVNSQFCRGFQNAQRCTVSVLQECENATTSYEANAVLNIVKQTIGCDDLLKI